MDTKPLSGPSERLHARQQYYGKQRYDLVEVSGKGGETWYARVMAFFDVQVDLLWRRMALLHWLEVTHPTHVPGALTFRYWSKRPDVVAASTILRAAHMITSPRKHEGTDEVCFVLLPYGKWCPYKC